MAELKEATRSGPGRLLIAVYGVFVIAAASRSAVQIATRFERAPLAYVLSALAAAIYIVATICLVKGSRTSRRIATISCVVELVGVVVVGTISLFARQAFPDATVWSFYGQGYCFVPLVLPILGLWWIRVTSEERAVMDVVYQTLVVLHLLGMAAILGGVITELAARRDGVPKIVLHGAVLQVLTGIALVGLASSGAVDVDVDNVKAAVKLTVAVAVLVLAFLARRKASMGRTGLRAVGALALANVLVAVYW